MSGSAEPQGLKTFPVSSFRFPVENEYPATFCSSRLFRSWLAQLLWSGVIRRAAALHLPVYILPQFDVFKTTLASHGNHHRFQFWLIPTRNWKRETRNGNQAYFDAGGISSGALAGFGPTRSIKTCLMITGVTGRSSSAGVLAIALITVSSSHWPKMVCLSSR